jgi:pSer/pThr/pTyr-binding forkhead associated (FHA) protein
MWLLQGVAENGTDPLTFRVLPGSAKTMGRAVRADFVVDATLVSRLHCRVVATGTRLEVEDLDSTNGTFVNDRRVERAVLAPGDILRIGRVELTVVREGGDPPRP